MANRGKRRLTRPDLEALLNNPNVRTTLDYIRKYESSDRYNVFHGGSTFDSYADHPNKKMPTQDGGTSTAAGGYQFLNSTWKGLAPTSAPTARVWQP